MKRKFSVSETGIMVDDDEWGGVDGDDDDALMKDNDAAPNMQSSLFDVYNNRS